MSKAYACYYRLKALTLRNPQIYWITFCRFMFSVPIWYYIVKAHSYIFFVFSISYSKIFAVAVNELSLKKPISETSHANATSSCLRTYPLWLLGCGLIFREFTLQLNWMMPWILPLLDQRSPAKLLIDAVSIFLRYPLFILYCYVYL